MAANVGGGLVFTGIYNTGGAYEDFAGIRGYKANGTDNNYSGGMYFITRTHGNTPAIRMKIDENGNVDFYQHQAIQFRIENRTSDPSSPATGEIWLRTDV